MINPFKIIKSRFIDGETLPQWYEDRLEICSKCPLNSKNIEGDKKSLGRKSWELIAGSHCTEKSCGCTIVEKAKIKSEQCPDTPPRWLAEKKEEVENNESTDVKVENLSPHKVTLTKDGNRYTASYGDLSKGEDSKITIKIFDTTSISNISSTCGCTVPERVSVEDGQLISIKYDTKRVGQFNKTVTVTNQRKEKIFITIKGTVKNKQ